MKLEGKLKGSYREAEGKLLGSLRKTTKAEGKL